jgi:hypothetical protein
MLTKFTEEVGEVASLGLYLRGCRFSTTVSYDEVLRGFPQFLYVNSGLVYKIETEYANKSLL